ncbi:MAG: L-aspartate oxidase [Hyphomicrobiaceae bacterium]
MHEAPPNWNANLSGTGDIVIVGAGLAGLFTALKLSPQPVTVVAAAPLGKGASSVWAQGGVAAAVGKGDTTEAHARDTISSGAGLVDEALAHSVAKQAPERIRDLLSLGVPFDHDLEGNLKVSKEAAHSAGRVVRVSGDRAGGAIMSAIIASVRNTPSIRVLEGYRADDLITENQHIIGLVLSDTQGQQLHLDAKAIVLATGGIGALYEVSTNPPYARGEAIAMAARAGAIIADAEFVQFHPTALNINKNPTPLATEALRGEGAILLNQHGHRFLLDRDPRAELASRDIVSQAVAEEIAAGNDVFLDCSKAIGDRFPDDFPTVWQHCLDANIDPRIEPIPVVPAAHYHMGGIATNADGRTNVAGLWAIGETAATGLHGGNRLASNSLLEAVAFGARAAADLATILPSDTSERTQKNKLIATSTAPASIGGDEHEKLCFNLRQTMSQSVGVSRNGDDLKIALSKLAEIENVAKKNKDVILSNMALAARFIATAAFLRNESRGAHLRRDFPDLDANLAKRSALTLREIDVVLAKEVK